MQPRPRRPALKCHRAFALLSRRIAHPPADGWEGHVSRAPDPLLCRVPVACWVSLRSGAAPHVTGHKQAAINCRTAFFFFFLRLPWHHDQGMRGGNLNSGVVWFTWTPRGSRLNSCFSWFISGVGNEDDDASQRRQIPEVAFRSFMYLCYT